MVERVGGCRYEQRTVCDVPAPERRHLLPDRGRYVVHMPGSSEAPRLVKPANLDLRRSGASAGGGDGPARECNACGAAATKA